MFDFDTKLYFGFFQILEDFFSLYLLRWLIWCTSLEVIDHMIIKLILGAQSKVPTEQLYLETGCLPLSYVITARRMIYLKTILDRHKDEITSRIYYAMKENPYKGDWYILLLADFKKVGLELDEKSIIEMEPSVYKNYIKLSVWNAAYKELLNMKSKHIKVKHIKYDGKRAPQQYLNSSLFDNKMCSLLFNLRCKSVNNFRDNFHSKYGEAPKCKLCGKENDSQEHAIPCEAILSELMKTDSEMNIQYDHIFGTVEQQYNITKLYQKIIQIREKFEESTSTAYLGENTGPL